MFYRKFNIHILNRRHILSEEKLYIVKHVANITWDSSNKLINYRLRNRDKPENIDLYKPVFIMLDNDKEGIYYC